MFLLRKFVKRRHKYLILEMDTTHFVKQHYDEKNMFSESDIIKMLDFLIGSIFDVCLIFFYYTIKIFIEINRDPLLIKSTK